MNPNTKKIITRCIYIALIVLMMGAFIYLSEKYKDNSKVETKTMNSYYEDLVNDNYEVITGTKFINLIRNGKSIILVGSSNSEWSKSYIKNFDRLINNINVDTIYYYDINNDKTLLNSNYYEILDLLEGYLVTTDESNSNLLAPCLYIIENGKVLYYNVDTIVMKNTDNPSSYWNREHTEEFDKEITNAINKYYLNINK